jgi:NADH:ubiquinone oxidoreductase subunit E
LPDSQVEKMLHFFTFLSVGHIKDLMVAHQREPEKRKAQMKLAEQVFNLKRIITLPFIQLIMNCVHVAFHVVYKFSTVYKIWLIIFIWKIKF